MTLVAGDLLVVDDVVNVAVDSCTEVLLVADFDGRDPVLAEGMVAKLAAEDLPLAAAADVTVTVADFDWLDALLTEGAVATLAARDLLMIAAAEDVA